MAVQEGLEKPAFLCQAWAGWADVDSSQSRQLAQACAEPQADLDGGRFS